MDSFTIDLKNLEKSLTATLNSEERGIKIARIINSALSAVNPFSAVMNTLAKRDRLNGIPLQEINLSDIRQIKVVGAGKAGHPMAEAVHENF